MTGGVASPHMIYVYTGTHDETIQEDKWFYSLSTLILLYCFLVLVCFACFNVTSIPNKMVCSRF